jgi:hypothetical protein
MQIDNFGKLSPPDQDTLLISEDRIPGGVQAKLPLANTVHQLNARSGDGRVSETFEAEHRPVATVPQVLRNPSNARRAQAYSAAPNAGSPCQQSPILAQPSF